MRTRYVLRDGELVEKRYAAPLNASAYVISDHLDDVVCPLNGRPYDSKSAFYRTVRDAGCEIAGNDSSLTAKPREFSTVPNVERDIKTAIEQLRAGYRG